MELSQSNSFVQSIHSNKNINKICYKRRAISLTSQAEICMIYKDLRNPAWMWFLCFHSDLPFVYSIMFSLDYFINSYDFDHLPSNPLFKHPLLYIVSTYVDVTVKLPVQYMLIKMFFKKVFLYISSSVS